jgi:Domain of unknown function (DUF4423)
MNIFSETDYKLILRERVQETRRTRPAMTLRSLSSRIPIQYTYLSRALRSDSIHLNEDHLFSLCRMLGFLTEETEYVLLLRALGLSQDSARRSFLQNRISRIRRSKEMSAKLKEFQSSQLNQDVNYLFDPLAVLVHASLFNREICSHPRRLVSLLGITPERLQQILKALCECQFIEMSPTGEVTKINERQIHYGTDHPLMRVHQNLLKSQAVTRLVQTDEKDKYSILSTFCSDEDTFRKLQERFKAFLKEAETLVGKSRSTGTYQLSFDLFKWL